jgi:hypothetical protein
VRSRVKKSAECSSWNIRAVLPEHCGKLGKLGKPP